MMPLAERDALGTLMITFPLFLRWQSAPSPFRLLRPKRSASDASSRAPQIPALPAVGLYIPETIQAVVVAYNLSGIPTGLNLIVTTIAKIFQGNIKMWNGP